MKKKIFIELCEKSEAGVWIWQNKTGTTQIERTKWLSYEEYKELENSHKHFIHLIFGRSDKWAI